LGVSSGGAPLPPSPPLAVGCLVGSQPSPLPPLSASLSPPPLPLDASLAPCRLSPCCRCCVVVALAVMVVALSSWLWPWLLYSLRRHCGRVVTPGASSLVLVVIWCPPGRPHGRGCPLVLVVIWCPPSCCRRRVSPRGCGCPPVVLVAMCWPPLVLILVWCPPGCHHGCVVPHSPLWLLVLSCSSSSSWVFPRSSWLYGGPPACHHGLVVPPCLSSSPWVPPTRSRGHGCVHVWCPLNPYPDRCSWSGWSWP
jgi:hypothetical protein